MDVCESEQPLQKQSTVGTTRLPLVPAENKNGITRQAGQEKLVLDIGRLHHCNHWSKTVPFAKRRQDIITVNSIVAKRATSAERKRLSRHHHHRLHQHRSGYSCRNTVGIKKDSRQ
ncbi:UNVERIFIED_CONTAM: hypothetical protein Sradi_4422800 [Sesamum radiatum]|uniref:Uncharacterized protein n=1 Tax=Sesamum radiatum TaxID=300843 RepID=A0AAW2NPW3_SESRA